MIETIEILQYVFIGTVVVGFVAFIATVIKASKRRANGKAYHITPELVAEAERRLKRDGEAAARAIHVELLKEELAKRPKGLPSLAMEILRAMNDGGRPLIIVDSKNGKITAYRITKKGAELVRQEN